jgi:hypothetical protein
LRTLERAAHELSPDQRLVLACQIGLQMSAGEFCARFGWSHEKHRKVAQRARARLRWLTGEPITAGSARETPDGAERTGNGSGRGAEQGIFEDECPVSGDESGEKTGTLL